MEDGKLRAPSESIEGENMPIKIKIVCCCLFFVGLFGRFVSSAQENKPPAAQFPESHFHHLHLNATDPKAAMDFYTTKFDAEKAKFAGLLDGVWAQKSWMFFTKVATPPVADITSTIWHFGWGAEDMKATYAKHVAEGTKFDTPLTDISDIGGNVGAKDLFYYAYVKGPDGALIELNTANHHRFGHLHLFSEDPIAAGEFYQKYFGARRLGARPPSREPRMYREVQIGPSVSLISDNVNIIIFPIQYPKKVYADQWKGRTSFDSTKGHVVDHISYSFENLAEALELLRKDGVKVTDEIRSIGKIKFAFIEGPDKMRIEVIEGHAKKE
jgi:catechol 2,3-dioxygenase-like lactoylglutathione lyase family enzyme